MEQLTEHQAIELAKSGIWKTWTDEQIVRFQLFQERLSMDFSTFQKAMEQVLKRPVFTHEFAFVDELRREYLGTQNAPTLKEIINLIPKDKRILIGL